MRASRGAAPKRPTEPRQAESWSGVGKLTIRATKRSRASRGAGPQSGDYRCSTHGIAPGILDQNVGEEDEETSKMGFVQKGAV